ncbi:MAG TPA: hypothetical protein VLZ09_06640, partial [Gaiellaceae bacterium]|nr:hypothetical protein [Gaiellaceae bacterium]
MTLRRPLAIQRLAVARGVLERGQTSPRGALRGGATATGGGQNCGGSQEAAEDECPQAAAPSFP